MTCLWDSNNIIHWVNCFVKTAMFFPGYTEPPEVQSDTESSSSSQFIMIIGVTVGVGVLIIITLILSVALYMSRRKGKKRGSQQGAAGTPSEGVTNPSYMYYTNNNNEEDPYDLLPLDDEIELRTENDRI